MTGSENAVDSAEGKCRAAEAYAGNCGRQNWQQGLLREVSLEV